MTLSGNVIPVQHLIRIRVSGSDRASFLHNFCTNDINALDHHRLCEAFFVNVKARVLAHGYILAGSNFHEIWMLPGNESQLLNHLTRYVITEDVEFETLTESSSAVAMLGTAETSDTTFPSVSEGCWQTLFNHADGLIGMAVKWNGTLLRLISGPASEIEIFQQQPSSESHSTGIADFERLRIQERFPRIGSDLAEDNLAPEALRNGVAICYTKGCYLGQEPIARLDAMGQVNRCLVAVEVHGGVSVEADAYDLTSFDDSMKPPIGLAVVRAKDLTQESIVVRTPAGTLCSATITKPASLDEN